MDGFEHDEKAPPGEASCLLTVVSPRKDEGNSPTGIVGRHLARQLLATGRHVRVLAEPDQCDGWPGAVEVVEGSITRPLECARAFDGVGSVFLAGARPSTVKEALALARDAGAAKVVLLSSHGPEYEEANPPETWYWLAIERAVEHSGMAWTHIRPSAVMGAVIEGTYPATGSDWPDTVRADGVVREAFLGEGHYPFIHEEDLAAVAAAALTGDDHVGTVMEAVGPPLSTRARIRSIAAALGRDIAMVDLAPDEGRAAWRALGWPEGAIDVTLHALEVYGAQYTELLRWTLDQRPSVQDVIGRPPRTYDAWVSENIDSFR
ncbi:NAD(P)H-binding protein [Streptomyces sp. NBC_01214]|uniref:NAD(P)H-binding protein n=1 Tax=Streptomyces sp. NBC_01214 TaxID=2903777 RepID=UPI00225AC74E|nr:NAD(P)H-binding protein [Streptomyces sp. NBC_01214]MCX4803822.1 NAD(P)H-binding protein [Streptomyces sp. NBC_01214]